MKKITFKFGDVGGLIDEVLSLDYFSPNVDEVVPIPFKLVKGTSKLVLVIGGNASGKSFFRRLTKSVCHNRKPQLECIDISVEGRTRAGVVRGMIYGTEEYDSTGYNSAQTVLVGISTCRTRESDHVIVWDEPDLGLSEDSAMGMGEELREFFAVVPEKTLAGVVVTHSKALVRELVSLDPHVIFLGEDTPGTLQEWLDRPTRAVRLTTIREEGRKRYRLIQDILAARRAT